MSSAPDRKPVRREQARTIAMVALAALVILFAVLNLDEVEVNWVVATWQTPLVALIAFFTAVGAAAGWLAARLRRD